MSGFDVDHVARAAAPLVEVWAGWTWAKRSGTASPSRAWPSPSGTYGQVGAMLRRLGRTPLLRRGGQIKAKRWTR